MFSLVYLGIFFSWLIPITFFLFILWMVVKRLEQGKMFRFLFPSRYFVCSLIFSLIIMLYGIYPHDLSIEYTGNDPHEFFQIKAAVEEPVFRFVGLALLANLACGLWFVLSSKPYRRGWVIVAVVLTFQLSGLASTYTISQTVGLGD